MSINDVKNGQRVSFSVYPVAVLPNSFKDVVFEGTFSAAIAINLGRDIQAMHANAYSSLPAGTVPDDPTQYEWMSVLYASGAREIIGVPYVRASSVVVSGGGTLTLVFKDKTPADIELIQLQLAAVGHTPDKTTVTQE